MQRCPCGSGTDFETCCHPIHRGAPAVTAEALMRSRFSAFAVGDADYLLTSWHPQTRPRRVEFDDSVVWRRLQIVDTGSGGPEDSEGTVEFRATYIRDGEHGVLHERSSFSRVDGRWVYVDGAIVD